MGLVLLQQHQSHPMPESVEGLERLLSRETAKLVSRPVDDGVRGEQVPANAEVTPPEAAVLLGVSRTQVRRLMIQGLLEFREVDTHHRIRVSSIRAFLDAERPRRREALANLAVLQDELGLTE